MDCFVYVCRHVLPHDIMSPCSTLRARQSLVEPLGGWALSHLLEPSGTFWNLLAGPGFAEERAALLQNHHLLLPGHLDVHHVTSLHARSLVLLGDFEEGMHAAATDRYRNPLPRILHPIDFWCLVRLSTHHRLSLLPSGHLDLHHDLQDRMARRDLQLPAEHGYLQPGLPLVARSPLGPLAFRCSQHRRTPRHSVEQIRLLIQRFQFLTNPS